VSLLSVGVAAGARARPCTYVRAESPRRITTLRKRDPVMGALTRRPCAPARAHERTRQAHRPVPYRRSLTYDFAVSAIAEYRAASEANDVEALIETLSPNAELVSPLSGRLVFRGRADLGVLLGAVYGTLRELRWREEMSNGSSTLLIGTMRVGPFRLDDAMVFELGADGLIARIRPHLRPWLATTFFALILGPKIARHPGVVARALSGSGTERAAS
jgi:hypothetical protein